VIGAEGDRLRDEGLRRASQFSWGATAQSTLDVYREVAEMRRRRPAVRSSTYRVLGG
jgi:hypothetical protein